jgi:hypothetical protein
MNGRDLQGIETNCSRAVCKAFGKEFVKEFGKDVSKKNMGLMDIKQRVYFTTPFFTNYNGSHFYSHFFFEKYVFFIYLHEFSQFLQGSSTIKKLSNSYYFLPN